MRVYSFVIALLFLISCSESTVKISGNFNGLPDKENIYLELVSTKGQKIVDSTQTKKGGFVFKVKLDKGQPAIYNIRHKEHIIPLLVSEGDRIKLSALGNISQNYTVDGSPGSSLMHEITHIMNDGAASLDSLTNIYTKVLGGDDSLRQKLAAEYAQQYYKIKRDQIRFIVTNPGSLAAMYALYQRLPNDNVLFNGDNDIVYFRLVADSLGAVIPNSPYVISLRKEIDNFSSNMSIGQMIEQAAESATISNFPDLELSDMYGKKVKLSSLNGKVILLDFWSAASADSRMANAELKEAYEELADEGFEVYQVSLDTSKPLWVTTVQDQKLPWISVCDFRGANSSAARLYNIQSLPANFLIDRTGRIAAKNVPRSAIVAKVKQLL